MGETVFPPELLAAVRRAGHIAVLTGAGVSAESGIPTFRDAQKGLWAKYRPEELATREAFERDPQRIWEWYAYRRRLIAEAQPNRGHYALAELEQVCPAFTLVTQNVDGLHQTAGSHHVLELHGSIWRAKCFNCDYPHEGNLELAEPPTCPRCGGRMRPDVVWYGEPLPATIFDAAVEAARNCALFLIVGTSALVQPAASLPLVAVEQGAPIVEVNPEATPLTPLAAYSLRGKSGEILPALLNALAETPEGRSHE